MSKKTKRRPLSYVFLMLRGRSGNKVLAGTSRTFRRQLLRAMSVTGRRKDKPDWGSSQWARRYFDRYTVGGK